MHLFELTPRDIFFRASADKQVSAGKEIEPGRVTAVF
jgi:hypothetical protein